MHSPGRAAAGRSFGFGHEMGITPLGHWAVVRLAFATVLPGLLLLLLVVLPIGHIIDALAAVVL